MTPRCDQIPVKIHRILIGASSTSEQRDEHRERKECRKLVFMLHSTDHDKKLERADQSETT